MERSQVLLLDALRCALRGEAVSWPEAPGEKELHQLFRLAREQSVLPLVLQAVGSAPELSELPAVKHALRQARFLTLHQAARTADFLLVLEALAQRGLHPAVLKGLVCRALYPEPEQRASTDEDLLIAPEEASAYHEALLACGLRLEQPEAFSASADEITYVDPRRDLYLEVHLHPFPEKAEAYGACNRAFEDALSRVIELRIHAAEVKTLAPTDHLLYLLCHAYKHMLYGGVGVRQLCDACLFARRCAGEIEWDRVRAACAELGILTLAAAIFRVGERRLDIPVPDAFADLDPDETPLLLDCLTGGVYGAEDPDRLRSGSLTLEAVAARRQGRRERTALRALFPPAASLRGRYPYLKGKPWLLPLAWGQRFCRYAGQSSTRASRSLEIGRERIALLKQYELLK